MIRLINLHKQYGTLEVLKGVSLCVGSGEVCAVIGPSGCGKSTMLRCINLLEEPTSGTVVVADKEFRFEPGSAMPASSVQAALRQSVGMVFQSFDLFPHMTVLQNVMAGPVIVRRSEREKAKQLALSLLAKVGLAEKANSFPRALSGGQAQRVAIARALAMEPRVMLFDEVTSALDPELVGEVLDVIRRLAGEGITMVLVTHEIAFARDVATNICFMDDGQIVEQGTPDEVLVHPKHQRTIDFLRRFRA